MSFHIVQIYLKRGIFTTELIKISNHFRKLFRVHKLYKTLSHQRVKKFQDLSTVMN